MDATPEAEIKKMMRTKTTSLLASLRIDIGRILLSHFSSFWTGRFREINSRRIGSKFLLSELGEELSRASAGEISENLGFSRWRLGDGRITLMTDARAR